MLFHTKEASSMKDILLLKKKLLTARQKQKLN